MLRDETSVLGVCSNLLTLAESAHKASNPFERVKLGATIEQCKKAIEAQDYAKLVRVLELMKTT